MKYNFFSDPGHGWLKVPIAQLIRLNIYKEISSCSHIRGDCAFLEQDNDLHILEKACKERGETLLYLDHHTDRKCKIRDYAYYFLCFTEVRKVIVNKAKKDAFYREKDKTFTIPSKGLINSDQLIIEDENGFRYKRSIEKEFYYGLQDSQMFCFARL